MTGEYQGKLIDNIGEEHVAPWLAALERIAHKKRPSTRWRARHRRRLAKAAPEVLDATAARVRAIGIPCQVSY